MVRNSWYKEEHKDDPFYPEYLGIVTQYVAEVNFPNVSKAVKDYQNRHTTMEKLSGKKFKYRQTTLEECSAITGSEFNGVTPFNWGPEPSTGRPIKIILSEELLKNRPQRFYLGGGDQDTKIGISIDDFKRYHGHNLIITSIAK